MQWLWTNFWLTKNLNCTRLSKIKLFHKLGVSSCYKWSSFCLQSFAHCCSLLIILHSHVSVYLVLQTVTFSQDICSTMYFLNLISSSFFYLLYFIYLFIFGSATMLHGIQDLSSPSRDQTRAPCIRSVES